MENNTIWNQSVAAVCLKDGKVLLALHTYGGGKGKLIIPGGYLQAGETPEEAVRREFMEEVHVEIEPKEIVGIRFSSRDWYVVFRAEHISGEPTPDYDEVDEVLWIDAGEALQREDVPELTKSLIRCTISAQPGIRQIPYSYNGSLYGTE